MISYEKAYQKLDDRIQEIIPTLEIFTYYENITSSGIILSACFITWLVTYFKLGWGWFIIGVVYLTQMYRYQQMRLKSKIRKAARVEFGMQQLDLDVERVEWFNLFLARYWLQYEPGLSQMLRETIDAACDQYKPAFIEELRLTNFTLGSQAPRIESVKSWTKVSNDKVEMDFDIKFIPIDEEELSSRQKRTTEFHNVYIELMAKITLLPLKVILKELELSALVRVTFNLCGIFPHISSLSVSLLEKPQVSFKLIPIGVGDVNNMAALRAAIDQAVQQGVDFMTFPKQMNIDMLGTSTAAIDIPIGVLRIVIHEAISLKNVDIGSSSDPMALVTLGGKEIARTRVVDNQLDPKWNQAFNVIIYYSTLTGIENHSDELMVEVRHSSKIKNDPLLGKTAVLPLSKFIRILSPLENNGLGVDLFSAVLEEDEKESICKAWGTPLYDTCDMWIPLHEGEEAEHKPSIRLDFTFFPLDTLYLEKPRPISPPSGILQISVHQAAELSSKKTPNTYCAVCHAMGSELYRTPIKKRTNSPAWEHKQLIYCHNVQESRYLFQIFEDNGKLLGYVTVVVRDALLKEDWYPLYQGQGKVKLSFKFTPVDLSQSLVDKSLIPRREPRGVLRIQIVKANGLHNTELLGMSDPYCKLLVGREHVGTTPPIHNTLNPEWREAFFAIPYSFDENLIVDLYDFNELQKDKRLGKFTIRLRILLSVMLGLKLKQEDIDYVDMLAKDGYSLSQKAGTKTLELCGPVYLTKKDLEQKAAAPSSSNQNLNILQNESILFKSSAALLKQLEQKKLRSKGKIYLEIDFFNVLNNEVMRADFDSPVAIKMEELVKKPSEKVPKGDENQESIAKTKIDQPEAKSEPVEQLDHEKEEKNTEYIVAKQASDIQKVLDSCTDGILRIMIEHGQFNRRTNPYVIFQQGDIMLFQSRKTYAATYTPDWYQAVDVFVRYLGQIPFKILVKDQVEKDPCDNDPIIGQWEGNANALLGHASLRVPIRQRTNGGHDMGMLPCVGHLYISLAYYPVAVNVDLDILDEEGVLQYEIIRANNLSAVDSGGTSDPYVISKLNGKQIHKTKTISKELNPVWNENVSVDIHRRNSSILTLECYDNNTFSKHVLLGKVDWNLADIERGVVKTCTFDFHQGQLQVRYFFEVQNLTPVGIDMDHHLSQDQHTIGKFTKKLACGIPFATKPTSSKQISQKQKVAIDTSRKSSSASAVGLELEPSKNSIINQISSSALQSSNTDTQSIEYVSNSLDQENQVERTSVPTIILRKPTFDRKKSQLDDEIIGVSSKEVFAVKEEQENDELSSSSQEKEKRMEGTVHMYIKEAKGLKAVDSNGKSDPFVKLKHPEKQKSFFKTSVIQKSLDPKWENQGCSFEIPSYKIHVEVLDHNTFSQSKSLGTCLLDLETLFQNDTEFDTWFDLDTQGSIRISANLTYSLRKSKGKSGSNLSLSNLSGLSILSKKK